MASATSAFVVACVLAAAHYTHALAITGVLPAAHRVHAATPSRTSVCSAASEAPLSLSSDTVGGQVLELAFGYIRSRVAYQWSTLCAADLLSASGGSADAFANETGLDPVMCLRFLRAASGVGLVNEEAGGAFVPTELGRCLGCSGAPERGVLQLEASPEYQRAWGHFEEVLRTGHNGWEPAHGQPRIYDSIGHGGTLPRFGDVFYGGLRSWGEMEERQLLEAEGVRRLIEALPAGAMVTDVGGGEGSLSARLLALRPDISVTLQDQQVTIEAAQRNPALQRWRESGRLVLHARSFFDGVAKGDLFLCKYILHNWGDEQCIAILRRVRQAMGPTSRLLLVEHGPLDDEPQIRLLDLHMAVLCGGGASERSTAQYTRLVEQAGLAVRGLHCSAGAVHAIECGVA